MSIFYYNTKFDLPSDIINGNVYYTAEEEVYLDKDSQRCKLNLSFLKKILEKFLKILIPEGTEVTPPKTGSISIQKTTQPKMSISFNYTLTIPGLEDGTYGFATFKDGVSTFSITSDQPAKIISNIPVGLSFVLEEEQKEGWYTSTSTISGTVSEDGTVFNIVLTGVRTCTLSVVKYCIINEQQTSSSENFTFHF